MAEANNKIVRPFSITLLMVYGIIVGLANIALGIFAILDRNDVALIAESFHSPNQLVAGGIAVIIIGAIQIFLANALGQGSNVVRIIYAIVASFNLAGGAWAAIALHGEEQAAGIVAALFAILVLILLFNQRSDDFFEAQAK